MKNKKNKNTKKKEANTKITLKQERQCGWKAREEGRRRRQAEAAGEGEARIQGRARKPGHYIEPHVKNKMQEATDAERAETRQLLGRLEAGQSRGQDTGKRGGVRQLVGRRGGHAVEEDAAKYSKEHAKQKLRLRRRGRWGRRAQSTGVGLGCGNCLEVRAGVGAGKGEGVRGTPEGVRGAGDINWRERGGGRRLTLDSQRIKRKRPDPDALSAAVLAEFERCLDPRGGARCHVTRGHQDNRHPGNHCRESITGGRLPGQRRTRDPSPGRPNDTHDDRDGTPGGWTRVVAIETIAGTTETGARAEGSAEGSAEGGERSVKCWGTRWKRVGWGS
ncbi:hypothetical protein PMAC_002135, partial [Pneumocystis sp. 'macacae']